MTDRDQRYRQSASRGWESSSRWRALALENTARAQAAGLDAVIVPDDPTFRAELDERVAELKRKLALLAGHRS